MIEKRSKILIVLESPVIFFSLFSKRKIAILSELKSYLIKNCEIKKNIQKNKLFEMKLSVYYAIKKLFKE